MEGMMCRRLSFVVVTVPGLDNFFHIYMSCVDYWMLADNSSTPRVIVADAFRLREEPHIYNHELFNKIRSYVN